MGEFDLNLGGGNSDFLSIPPDGSVTVRIVTETYYRQVFWVDNKTQSGLTDSEKQSLINKGIKPSNKVIWGVIDRSDGSARIFETGVSVFNQVKALHQSEDWGDIRGYDIRITREGSGKESKYSVVPTKNSEKISDDEANMVLELDIPKICKGARKASEVAAEQGADGSVPDSVKESFPGANTVANEPSNDDIPFK